MNLQLETASFDYVGEVNPTLECAICRTAFHHPAMSPLCQHIFCTTCIVRALEISPTCPIDRSPLALEDLVEAPRIVLQLVEELRVQCPNAEAGCQVTCERGLLQGHLRDECVVQLKRDLKGKSRAVEPPPQSEDEVLTCEHCLDAIRAASSSAHAETCESVPVPCPHCASALPRSLHPSHLLTCPSVLIPCPHSTFGCAQRLPRAVMLEEHLEVSCAFEPIKAHLAHFTRKMSETESENTVLRRRCDGLEESMRDMRDMMEGLRKGLGEFYIAPSAERSSTPLHAPAVATSKEVATDAPLPPTIPIPPSNTAQEIARTSTPNPCPSDPINIPNGGSPPLINPRSSSLPPLTASVVGPIVSARAISSSPTHGRQLFPPRPPNPPSFAFPVYHSSAYPTSTSPPHTLPDSLNSLNNQIASLSSSIANVEARQSSALMNESIRIQEDLGSIKGILHGMRHQLHGLMMEVGRLSGAAGGMAMGSPPLSSGIGMGMGMGMGLGMGGMGMGRNEAGSGSDGGEGSNSDDDGVGGSQSPVMMPRYRYFSSTIPSMHMGPPNRLGQGGMYQMGGIKL